MNADPTLLQMKYADVVSAFATAAGISHEEALRFFYHSRTYSLMSRGISNMHCMSIPYLVEDLLAEMRGQDAR